MFSHGKWSCSRKKKNSAVKQEQLFPRTHPLAAYGCDFLLQELLRYKENILTYQQQFNSAYYA